MSHSDAGSRKTTRKVPVSHETSPLLDASSSSLQYAGGSFSSGLTPGSGSSSQVLHNGVTPRLPTGGHDQYTPSMDSLPRSVPNIGSVRNRPNSEEAQSVNPEMQGSGSVFHGADNGRDVENGTDYSSEGTAASPFPSPPRLKGTLSGRMTWQKAGSRVSDSDAWRFKYHQFMADMPALDNSTFGAGLFPNLLPELQKKVEFFRTPQHQRFCPLIHNLVQFNMRNVYILSHLGMPQNIWRLQ